MEFKTLEILKSLKFNQKIAILISSKNAKSRKLSNSQSISFQKEGFLLTLILSGKKFPSEPRSHSHKKENL